MSSRRVSAGGVSPTMCLYNTVTAVDKRMYTRTLTTGRSSHQEHADLTRAAVQCESQDVL